MRAHQSKCDACMKQQRRESWYKKPAVEWDGQFPIGIWSDDSFFWDSDELLEYLDEYLDQPAETDADRLANIQDHWLTPCRPTRGRSLNLMDFLNDELPEDTDDLPKGGQELEDAINAWLESIRPLSWTMTGERLCPDSLRRQLGGESC